MKRIVIAICLFVLVGLGLRALLSKRTNSKLADNAPRVLGISTDVLQKFKDASTKVGFHIYYPTSLPDGFSLDTLSINTFANGEIDYGLTSADASKHVIVVQRPNSAFTTNSLMLTAIDLKALQWTISTTTISSLQATLGQAPVNGTAPSGHEALTFSTNDGVAVEIFDNFGYGQLGQIAQAMQ